MEANPSCDSVLHLYFIRPSADPEQLLFFEGSFYFFFFHLLFLLLLIFSPHINYTDVLGAMCFATSQRKPQDFRSEEQPDVLGWQSTTRGSRLRLPDWAGPCAKPAPTNTGHSRNNSSANSQQLWGISFVSVWIFFFFFLLVEVITATIL